MWTNKHAPSSLSGVIGHGDTVERLEAWASEWEKGARPKPFLLAGPAGVGKTTMARCLALDKGWEVFELNASDTRDAETLEKTARVASSAGTLFGGRRMLLFDEVDGLFSGDRGGAPVIARILAENSCPIILTANDAWDKKLATIRGACELVHVKKVHPAVCAKLLSRIAGIEGIEAGSETLVAIAKNSGGDVRCAINDLQLLSQGKKKLSVEDAAILSKRDREENIFNALRTVFKSRDFRQSRQAIQDLQEEPSFVLRWLEHNAPAEFVDARDRHAAFEKLSRVDIFLSRVLRRQNFEFWRYATDLMAGVSIEKQRSHAGFVRYAFPSALRPNEDRKARKSLCLKVARMVHASSEIVARDLLSLLFLLASDPAKAPALAAQFSLEEEELAYLGVPDPGCCLEIAEEIREKEIAKSVASSSGLNAY